QICIHLVPLGRNRPTQDPIGPVPGGTLRRRAPPCSGSASGVRRGHAGSDLYRTNPGSSPDISTTAPTHSNPPATIENLVLTRLRMDIVTTTTLTLDISVRATPDQVWQALTDPAFVPRWRFGMSFDTSWRAGAPLTSRSPDGVGSVLDASPGKRLSYDWEQS